eukprot:TRINITY_DN2982_c0_g2_i1.p1 TRINITY_DN2982_c0_g2~~TRINITY_DN2982_c0_g2_i1.p1  ORF type:complete len:757 (-),score=119.66 TRINITY_DN2982_c0_g2_i1:259-2529(-)
MCIRDRLGRWLSAGLSSADTPTRVRVVSMDNYDVAQLGHEDAVLVITSTFGSGEAPINARAFARWMDRAKVEGGGTIKARFCVFGLGSSLFPHFAAFASKLDSQLCELSGPDRQLLPVRTGDEVGVANGMSQRASFDQWRGELAEALDLVHDSQESRSAGAVREVGMGPVAAGRVSLRVGRQTALALVRGLATEMRGLQTPALTATFTAAERLLTAVTSRAEESEGLESRSVLDLSAAELVQFFDSLDGGCRGKLSIPELRLGFTQLGLKIEGELEALDLDGDGFVDYDELLKLVGRPHATSDHTINSAVPVGDMCRRDLLLPRARPPSRLYPLFTRVLRNTELFSAHSTRSTRLVCLSTDSAFHNGLHYQPGDHIACFPCNHSDTVHSVCRLLGVSNPDMLLELPCDGEGSGLALRVLPLQIHQRNGECYMEATWWQLLSCYLDLLKAPPPAMCLALSTHCTDSEEASVLAQLGRGAETYHRWLQQTTPCVLSLLRQFRSMRIRDHDGAGIEVFLRTCPKMQPRLYSIASSPLAHPGEVHVVVSQNIYRAGEDIRRGVCSDWLHSLQPSSAADNRFAAPVFVARSNFRLPSSPVPVVLVAAGTGVAPFRGFWEHRRCVGGSPLTLYFGCRTTDEHMLKGEMEEAVADGALSKLRVAYSRGPKKQYVTALLAEDKEELRSTLSEASAGHLFLCGDVRVGEAVKKTLGEVGVDVEALKRSGRLHEEVFGLFLKQGGADAEPNMARVEQFSAENVKGF